jgi:hypothetical protein
MEMYAGVCSFDFSGFDHGAGHSLPLLYDAKASHGQNSK